MYSKRITVLIFLALFLASNKDLSSANENGKESQVMNSNSLGMRDAPDTMCGPHCLWQIAYTFGKNYSLGAIRNLCGTDAEKGTSMSGMVKASRSIGLKAKAVKTDIYYLKGCLHIPILLMDYGGINHFVIFDKIEGDQIKILDGPNYKTFPLKKLKSIWNGYAIIIGNYENRQTDRLQRYFGTCLQISGLLILLIATTYGVRFAYLHSTKRQ